jgi:hypothetical protein
MSQTAKKTKGQEYYQNVITRWETDFTSGTEYEEHFLKLQREYRKYYANVYVLNSQALKIQHAYYGCLAGTRKIIPILKRTPMNTSKVVFKAKYGLNGSTRVPSAKRKLKPPKGKKNAPFDNKENCEIERSIHASPFNHSDIKRSRVNSQMSENKSEIGKR